MFRLDNVSELEEFNKTKLASSILGLDKQIEQVVGDLSELSFGEEYRQIDNVVVCGMGGSGLATRIIASLYNSELACPIELVNDYVLPGYVGQNTLVLLSSYSGTTEEVLECAKMAEEKQAKIAYLCAGGRLAEIGDEKGWAGYSFVPSNNPSNQPRMGLGYAIASQLIMFAKLGLIKEADWDGVIESVRAANRMFGYEVKSEDNAAKRTALELLDREVAIVGSGHLKGSSWAMRNQIHENGKNFANAYFLPELNHHLMEGLGFPEGVQQRLVFVFLESANFATRIKQRIDVTKTVLGKRDIEFISFETTQKNKLFEVFEVLIFGSWVSYYLAYLNGIEPSAIPFVDLFKEKLASFDNK